MNNKPIKEYEDFAGEAGYVIVDGLTNETSGGKLKVPNYKDVTDGYVLTKTSNSGTDEVVWAQAGGSGITNAVSPLIIPAGYNDKIELQYDSDTLEMNGSNELTVKDPIPDTTSANDGDVLTYSSDAIVWAAPQGGGGGGGSDIVYLDLTTQDVGNATHLTAASLTIQQLISNIEAGKTIIARRIKTYNNVISNVAQIMLSYYWHGTMYGDEYNICFSPAGSGAPNNGNYVIISNGTGKMTWESDMWEASDIDEQ